MGTKTVIVQPTPYLAWSSTAKPLSCSYP